MTILNRRQFIIAGLSLLSLMPKEIVSLEEKLKTFYKDDRIIPPPLEYENMSYLKKPWKEISPGLEFSKINVYKNNELVDKVACVKVNPNQNNLKFFTAYNQYDADTPQNIEEWQRSLNALVLFNSAQYQGSPNWGAPCALALRRGKKIGPNINKKAAGMLVSDPKEKNLPNIDLLDFKYDKFDYHNPKYNEGVQHWGILLNREGNIKVNKTDWQANRTVVAKDKKNNFLVFTTEGGFFTLYNFGKFLKENKELDIHTAMNMDGGYEADMIINTPDFNYLTYGQYETYGRNKNASIENAKIDLPSVIGIFKK